MKHFTIIFILFFPNYLFGNDISGPSNACPNSLIQLTFYNNFDCSNLIWQYRLPGGGWNYFTTTTGGTWTTHNASFRIPTSATTEVEVRLKSACCLTLCSFEKITIQIGPPNPIFTTSDTYMCENETSLFQISYPNMLDVTQEWIFPSGFNGSINQGDKTKSNVTAPNSGEGDAIVKARHVCTYNTSIASNFASKTIKFNYPYLNQSNISAYTMDDEFAEFLAGPFTFEDYSWTLPSGWINLTGFTNESTITAMTNGIDATIYCNVENKCNNTKNLSLYYIHPNFMMMNMEDSKIMISPNPVKQDYVSINLEDNLNEEIMINISLVDKYGTIISNDSRKFNENINFIIGSLNPDTYYIMVSYLETSIVKRLIVN